MGKIPWLILISILHRWVQYLVCGQDRPLGYQNGTYAIRSQIFGSNAVLVYVMCLDYLNWALVEIPWMISISNLFDRSNSWGVDRTYPRDPEIDDLPLGWSYLVVVSSFMSCALIFLTGFYGWDFMADIFYQSFIDGSNFGGADRTHPWVLEMGSAIGPQLFVSSAVVWYIMCLDSLNWFLLFRFHGWYWYQSFIERSNILGVEGTDPLDLEMDHLPLGHSYLVVMPS